MALDSKVFVIVVTFNGRQWYDRCFSSLRESTIPIKTVVVDNASSDGSVDYIRQNYPEIHIIESEENLGFGRANNIAMAFALKNKCDFVFLLNQDAWIEPNAIAELVRAAERFQNYGIISPVHLTPEKDSLEPGFVSIVSDKNNVDGEWFNDMYWGHTKEIYETKYIHAAGWLLPRHTLDVVGGFDPIFAHYEEDDDYLNRCHYHGLKIGICPSAKMVHDCNRPYIYSKGKEKIRHQQLLMVPFLDISQNKSIDNYCKYLLRKWIVSLLRRRWDDATVFYSDFVFLLNNRKRIEESRKVNIKEGRSWLDMNE